MLYEKTMTTTKMMQFQGTKGDHDCKFNARCPSLPEGKTKVQKFGWKCIVSGVFYYLTSQSVVQPHNLA